MNFQHLAYWQEKAKNLAIETRLFINGNIAPRPIIPPLRLSTLPRSRH